MRKKHIKQLGLAFVLITLHAATHAGVCEYADTTYAKVSTGVAGTGVAAGVGLKIAGVTAVAHSSGAAIAATTASGYLAGTLGAIGAVAGFVTAPVVLVVGGAAVAAAGGTIAYCRYTKDEKPGSSAAPAPVKAK